MQATKGEDTVPRRVYGRDGGLTARMFLTMFGLGLIYVIFIAALIAAGVGAVFVLAFAAVFALVQLLFGDKLALASMGARTVEPHEAPELHAMVERLCQLTDTPKPRIAIAKTEMPNAFAAGHNRRTATICVTTGLMQRLEPRELEGVVAHELAHIINRDVVVMTVAGFLATVAGLLIRFGFYSGLGRQRGNNNTAAVFALVLVVSIVTYVLSFLLLRALSRYREYAADRGAAMMTGAPSALASALGRISGDMARIPSRDLRAAEGMNAFFIMPAHATGFSLSSLVSTHPPMERRIHRLMDMPATHYAHPGATL